MNLTELQNLDPNNIGGWPGVIKLLIVLDRKIVDADQVDGHYR